MKIDGYFNLSPMKLPEKTREDKIRTGKTWKQLIDLGIKVALKMREMELKDKLGK